jgi:hypothetical protein
MEEDPTLGAPTADPVVADLDEAPNVLQIDPDAADVDVVADQPHVGWADDHDLLGHRLIGPVVVGLDSDLLVGLEYHGRDANPGAVVLPAGELVPLDPQTLVAPPEAEHEVVVPIGNDGVVGDAHLMGVYSFDGATRQGIVHEPDPARRPVAPEAGDRHGRRASPADEDVRIEEEVGR